MIFRIVDKIFLGIYLLWIGFSHVGEVYNCILIDVFAHQVGSPVFGEHDPIKIKQHLNNGINPNSTCLSGLTPLHWSRNAETTRVLIEAGAKINARDSNLDTPLHLVPDAQSVKLLIAHGASLNARNYTGDTPLHTAKNAEIAQALLDAGADINAYNRLRQTPLHVHHDRVNTTSEELKSKRTEIVDLLVRSGSNTNLTDRIGNKPLTQTSKNFDVNLYSSDTIRYVISGILFSIGIVFLFASRIFNNRTRQIFGWISLLSNPFLLFFSLTSYIPMTSVLYWLPGSVAFITLLHCFASFIFYHRFMLFISKSTFDTYLSKSLSYCLCLIPYSILLITFGGPELILGAIISCPLLLMIIIYRRR